ncbi:MAG: hypothetical protein ACI9WT_000131 [Flavobacterium sp.]|jgi:hypothetical protein
MKLLHQFRQEKPELYVPLVLGCDEFLRIAFFEKTKIKANSVYWLIAELQVYCFQNVTIHTVELSLSYCCLRCCSAQINLI